MSPSSSQSKLPNLSRFVGRQGGGRTDVSVKAKELLGESIATKYSVKWRRHASPTGRGEHPRRNAFLIVLEHLDRLPTMIPMSNAAIRMP
jgi:hypothetical protein